MEITDLFSLKPGDHGRVVLMANIGNKQVKRTAEPSAGSVLQSLCFLTLDRIESILNQRKLQLLRGYVYFNSEAEKAEYEKAISNLEYILKGCRSLKWRELKQRFIQAEKSLQFIAPHSGRFTKCWNSVLSELHLITSGSHIPYIIQSKLDEYRGKA